MFEFEPKDAGGQGTMLAGGRYDPLIGILGGPSTPGIGFGSGIERIIKELVAQDVAIPAADDTEVVIISVGAARSEAAQLAARLRSNSISTVLAPDRSFKAQMRYANHLQATSALILGERELESGMVSVKPMKDGSPQTEVTLGEVVNTLKQ